MPASKQILQLVKQIIHEERRGMPSAGPMSKTPFTDLQRMNPGYQYPGLRLTNHSVVSRFDNRFDGWSEERIAEAIEKVLGSESTRGMPNFMGGKRSATEALIVPEMPSPIFAPVFPTPEGNAGLATIFETTPEKVLLEIQKMTSAGGAILPSSTVNHQIQDRILGDAVSQLDLSAVSAMPPSIQDILARLKGGVKAAAPVAATGGILGMMGQAGEAAAAAPEPAPERQWAQWDDAWGDDAPLESPVVDPIDMMVAPIGAATWLGKAATVAAEPAIGLGAHYLFGRQ